MKPTDSSSRALISNEEMHKIGKLVQVCPVLNFDRRANLLNCWSFLINSSMFGFRVGNHMLVKSPGVARVCKVQMPHSCPGGGEEMGAAGID